MSLATFKMTAMVNLYSLLRIPLLAFITPVVQELSETRSVVRVRLDPRTRNHLGTMYFGALAMGAELSVAVRALDAIAKSGKRVDFIFKDFQCDFLKRADGHVRFICNEADGVAALVNAAAADLERHEQTFQGYAVIDAPSADSTAPVIQYKITLSVKQRTRKS